MYPRQRYGDPLNPLLYKRIFGKEKNKDVLIHFLNDVLSKKVKDVTLLNPVQNPEIAAKKQSIIDVLCTDDQGTMFIVEMQVAKVKGFEKRAQYYAAKAYGNQLNEGEAYHQLKEVIFLAIADFEMFPKKRGYKSEHVILDRDSYEHDLQDFSFTFVELPKFKIRRVEDLTTYEEKWYYFFKHSNNPEDMDKLIQNSDLVMSKAYQELLSHNWTEEELTAYEAVTKSNLDAIAREEQVRYEGEQKGKAEGLIEGKAEGLIEGKAEGLIEGKAEGLIEGKAEGLIEGKAEGLIEGKAEGLIEGEQRGIEKSRIEIAKRMLAKNKSLEEIADLTGFSVEEIIKLKG